MVETRDVDLLKLLRKDDNKDLTEGLKVVELNTNEAADNPFTFVFKGSDLVLDFELFEVPNSMYPLHKGDKFLAYPIIGDKQRWGLVEKISSGVHILEVNSTIPNDITFNFEGSDVVYSLDRFEVPVSMYPIRDFDKFLVKPLDGPTGTSQRFAITEKITGGTTVIGTLTGATSASVDGLGADITVTTPSWVVISHTETQYIDNDEYYNGPKTTKSDMYLRGDNEVVRPPESGDEVAITATGSPDSIDYRVVEFYI